MPLSILKQFDADPDTLRRKFPSLVIVAVSPYGLGGPEKPRGDIASWWGKSFLCSLMGGKAPSIPPEIPAHFGDQIVSNFTFTAAAMGFYHMATTGEGQVLEVNMLRVAFWVGGAMYTFFSLEPAQVTVMMRTREEALNLHFIPTFNAHMCKDGRWMQLLGLDPGRHLGNTARSLGIRWPLYTGLVVKLVTKVLPSRAKNKLEKLLPLVEHLNCTIRAGMAKFTYDELAERNRLHDVWFCPTRTPAQAAAAEHFRAIGSVTPVSKDRVLVEPPVSLSSVPHVVPTHVADLGADNERWLF
mmetsp:Transcript_62251/g.147468  ORF Transcript_62251/g.147468 Transcript_62251/m.147468 type:complete len:299 (-) Transcript_62251:24-920(-)